MRISMRGWATATVTLLPRIVVSLRPSPAAKLLSANPLQQNVEPSYGVCLEVTSKRGTPESWVSILTCSNFCFRNPYFRKPPCGKSCYSNWAAQQFLLPTNYCSKSRSQLQRPRCFSAFFSWSQWKNQELVRQLEVHLKYLYIYNWLYI